MTAAFNRVLKKLADQSTELIAQKEVAESAALAKSRFLAAASSGAAIIQLLAGCERMPDLIICDHRLRDNKTGGEVIQRLRDEFNSDIPALLITGDTAPERIQAILETGIPILHKPLEDWALKQAVTRLLQAVV